MLGESPDEHVTEDLTEHHEHGVTAGPEPKES